MDGQHRYLPLGIADPDRGLEPWEKAAEPGVGVIVSRPRLAGRRFAEVGPDAGAARHVLLEDPHDLGGDPVGNGALALWHAPAGLGVDLASRQNDFADRHGSRVDAPGSEGRIHGGHVHRRHDAGAETHRRHVHPVARAQIGPDAEPVGDVRDVVGNAD